MEDRFESFTKDITSIYRSVQKIKDMEMTEFGLKGVHVMCLYFLYKNPNGLTAKKLCDMCCEDKGAISRSIATLKEKQLVEESQSDLQKKYRSIIRLTPSGVLVAQKETKKIVNAVIVGGKGLSDDKREGFYSSLNHISKNLSNYVDNLKLNQ